MQYPKFNINVTNRKVLKLLNFSANINIHIFNFTVLLNSY